MSLVGSCVPCIVYIGHGRGLDLSSNPRDDILVLGQKEKRKKKRTWGRVPASSNSVIKFQVATYMENHNKVQD